MATTFVALRLRRRRKKRKINSTAATAAAAAVVKQMTMFLPRMARIGCGPIKLYEAIVIRSIDLLDVLPNHVGQAALMENVNRLTELINCRGLFTFYKLI